MKKPTNKAPLIDAALSTTAETLKLTAMIAITKKSRAKENT